MPNENELKLFTTCSSDIYSYGFGSMRFDIVIVVFPVVIAFCAKISEFKTSQSGLLLLMSDPRSFHIEASEYCL